MEILGIDIGGTAIKSAPVDVARGELLAPLLRLPTPQPSLPEAVAEQVKAAADHFDWRGAIGIGFPAVVQNGITLTAANVDPGWVNRDARSLFHQAADCPVWVINDADAAGLAEMRFGAGKDQPGVVLLITIGTGLGSSLFVNGQLLPNTEFGHIEINGEDAEFRASEAARLREGLSWEEWASRLTRYLNTLEKLLWPDLIILGGGVIQMRSRFFHLLKVRTRTVPALMGNNAGLVGAALAAAAHIQ